MKEIVYKGYVVIDSTQKGLESKMHEIDCGRVDGFIELKLYEADPDCIHEIEYGWSGVKCTKCSGWLCY